MDSARARVQRAFQAVVQRFEARSPRVERALLVVAAVVFVATAAVGLARLPDLDDPVRWPLLALVVLVLVPLSVLINAGEFHVMARIVDSRVTALEAVRVSALATAANVLPMPGAVVVKTRALRQQGRGYRASLGATGAVGVVWAGLGGVVAGAFVLGRARLGVGLVLLGAGLVGVALGSVVVAGVAGAGRGWPMVGRAVGVELLSVASTGVRFFVVLRAIGADADWPQTFTLAAAAIFANAAGVFPGGLGLREVLSGVAGPLVGLPAAVGVVAAAADRALGYVGMVLVAAVLLVIDRRGATDGAVPSSPRGG